MLVGVVSESRLPLFAAAEVARRLSAIYFSIYRFGRIAQQ